MNKNKENLKSIILKKYENYIDEKDKTNALKAIADFFKLPIDISRKDDYLIKELNPSDLSIEIYDKKTNTTLTSNYSKDSEFLGMIAYVESISFINVTIKENGIYRHTVYKIGENIPILERLIIHHNGYNLIFKRTTSGAFEMFHRLDGNKLLIMYSKEDGENQYPLVTSIYKTNYIEKNINSFERLYITSSMPTYEKNRPDNFFFDIEGNLVLGSKIETSKYCIEGACLEKVDENGLEEALNYPQEGSLVDYSNLDLSKTSSAILYAGYYYMGHSFNDIKITKQSDDIHVEYNITYKDYNRYIDNTKSSVFIMPCLNEGNISIAEIDNIIIELQKRYSDNKFIEFVINEILLFKYKLQVKSGLTNEVLNPLSSKLLFDKSFDEIYSLVTANKDEYFAIANNRFEELTNNYNYLNEESSKTKKKTYESKR